ncbi:MAG: response regulator [Oscillospiraceae bacterium]|nr:response regulator [Oscillospiraceae bacterium]
MNNIAAIERVETAEHFGSIGGEHEIEEKATVLIVDDMEINRMILDAILCENYNIEQAADGIEALTKLLGGICKPSLVLLDIMMPEIDGFEVLETMKKNDITKNIPVIFITAANPTENEAKGLAGGAIDYIVKPFVNDIVKLRVDNQIELSRYRENLEHVVNQKVNALTSTKEKMLSAMATVIEFKSLESVEHVKRTSILTGMIVDILLKNPMFRDELMRKDYRIMIKAAPLHDVGKIAVPDRILLKPGKYTPEEFKIMETHTTKGSEIIKKLLLDDEEDLYLRHCYDICRYHHERWDGNGYPDGMSGEDIPLSARIVSLVDVYDALVSQRVYKPPFTHEEAMQIIESEAGTKYDARIVEAFLAKQDNFKKIYNL